MIIFPVPHKMMRAVICAAVLWTSFTGLVMTSSPASAKSSSSDEDNKMPGDQIISGHSKLKVELEKLREKLSLPTNLTYYKDTSIQDPQYLRTLKLIGSWFLGDQIGESSIDKGLGGTPMEVTNQLYMILPYLKAFEAKEQAAAKDPKYGKTSVLDGRLASQSIVIENAISIYEIIQKLADNKVLLELKDKKAIPLDKVNEVVKALSRNIFETAHGGISVLIPTVWMSNFKGSMLMALVRNPSQKLELRIYDTKYFFDRNKYGSLNQSTFPIMIQPYRAIYLNSFLPKEDMTLVTALLALLDAAQMKEYAKNMFNTGAWGFLTSTVDAGESRENQDLALAFMLKKLLPILGKSIKVPEKHGMSMPLRRLTIGPVGDIQAFLMSEAINGEAYSAWKLGFEYTLLKTFLKRFETDADVHFNARQTRTIAEIMNRCANRLLRDAFDMARIQKWIPNQVGERDEQFWNFLHQNTKTAGKGDTRNMRLTDKANLSNPDQYTQRKLKLVKNAFDLRKQVEAWTTAKGEDTHKLEKLARSLGQREFPLEKVKVLAIRSTLETPKDLTDYLGSNGGSVDYSSCMAASGTGIKTLKEFNAHFGPMVKQWRWMKFNWVEDAPQCRPFYRRNAELLLRNTRLGGLDRDSLARWTPSSMREYKEFMARANTLLALITQLPNTERTMEDYVVLLRLQNVIWRVIQALDASFATKQPERHLDLVKYSLSVPNCRTLLKDNMTYSNTFLADSGAFGTILDTRTINELRQLCREMVEEEVSRSPILDFSQYAPLISSIVDSLSFTRINDGDREIYFRMGQHPKISKIIRSNHKHYYRGGKSVAENAAKATSLGEAGSQFIFFHFFDAVKAIFVSHAAVKGQVRFSTTLDVTYVPIPAIGSALLILPSKSNHRMTLKPVNHELLNLSKKSYLKTSITEMVTSHILGLDVIVNHLARGSTRFWSSGSIFEDAPSVSSGSFFQNLINAVSEAFEILTLFLGQSTKPGDRFELKAYRRDIAGTADFFLNCSAHLLRKLQVAPGYEEMVMTILMKTFNSVDKELVERLKAFENSDIQSILDKKPAVDAKKKTENASDDKYNRNNGKSNEKAENDANKDYLINDKISPDEQLKSLINWATIALRFADRIQSLKPEWRDRYADVPRSLYATLIKYSRAKEANNRRLATFDPKLVSHVDYFLFMACAMNLNDTQLRSEVYDNLKPAGAISFPRDSSVLPTAMVFHRLLAVSIYEYDRNGPVTEDFISNQYGAGQVMDALSQFKEHNETLLAVMSQFISTYLTQTPEAVLKEYPQGDNLAKGVLVYGQFAINLVQGTFTQNGKAARDPNSVMRFSEFRQFFSSGNEQVTPRLGHETRGCENRFEINDFLQRGTRYSICQVQDSNNQKKIYIYRHIPRFQKPCLLVRHQRVLESVQRVFSVYATDGIDLFQCRRGNNIHFVWIPRNSLNPAYISHGRLWHLSNGSAANIIGSEIALNSPGGLSKLKSLMESSTPDQIEPNFEFESQNRIKDITPTAFQRFFLPSISFPRLELCDIAAKTPVFPLDASTKLMVMPEPIIRFSGGAHFGTYNVPKNRLVFMFQRFRFRDRPEASITFLEGSDGTLEMRGREDLKVCEDQIFESNFAPAIMMRKTDDPEADIRFAFVPVINSEGEASDTTPIDKIISLRYNSFADSSTAAVSPASSDLVFMEAVAVQKVPLKQIIGAGGKPVVTYAYKLKPTSRLQRILLAFHNLKLRNYEESLRLLNPRAEIDHNTPLNEEERLILSWMVGLKSATEAEALALRFMAKMHLVLDLELFPSAYQNASSASSASSIYKDISDVPIKNDDDLLNLYRDISTISKTKSCPSSICANESTASSRNTSYNPPSAKLGHYFTVLPSLPKRFHVDQVFREAMGSLQVQRFMLDQYSIGFSYAINNNRIGKIVENEGGLLNGAKVCESDNMISSVGILGQNALVPLNAKEQSILQEFVDYRYFYRYVLNECEMPLLLMRGLIHLHANSQNIPTEMQELAMFYLIFSSPGGKSLKTIINTLGNPDVFSSNLALIRKAIDLIAFAREIKEVKATPQKYVETPALNRFSQMLQPFDVNGDYYSMINHIPDNSVFYVQPRYIIDPLLPHSSTLAESAEKQDTKKIKFQAEDFGLITLTDRKIYMDALDSIEAARLDKSVDPSDQLKLVKLFNKSKTQEALQLAIKDYLDNRKEPVDFDKLPANPFAALKTHIASKTAELDKQMAKLDDKYSRFFSATKENKKFLPAVILSKLKRIFNSKDVPSMKDLRDCFMRMSRSCLRNRLAEFDESSIVKIGQLLKDYYIRSILRTNLAAVLRKVKDFDDLAVKAAQVREKIAKAQSKSVSASEMRDLEEELFDHKDTALLSVEDLYNDMEKLLLLEQRLQDPVTLNFEFMSAKFNLTKVQVQDIANLATRNWEDDFRTRVYAAYNAFYPDDATNADKDYENASDKRLEGAVRKLRSIYKRYYLEVLDLTEEQRLEREENQKAGKSKAKDMSEETKKKEKKGEKTKSGKNGVKTSSSHKKSAIDKRYITSIEDYWAYLPRDERVIGKTEATNYDNEMEKRSLFKKYSNIGKLAPYNPAQDAYFSRVIQRKMAAGKTTVLGTAATVKKADGKTLSVLVILSALYQSSAPDMQKRTSDFFDTRGFAFAMPKPRLTIPRPGDSDHPAKNFLSWTLKTIINTINTNSYLVVTPETLQSFLNSYVEFLDAFVTDPNGKLNPDLAQCLHYFASIYEIFRIRGSVILDEIDSSMRPQKELNFPTTKRENILLQGVELTADLLLHSAFDKDVLEAGLNLLANQQAALNDDQYDSVRKVWKNYVASQLADENSIWYRMMYPQNTAAEMKALCSPEMILKFFFDTSALDMPNTPAPGSPEEVEYNNEVDWLASIKFKNEKVFHTIMVVKMQLKNWMRNCFKGSVNEHYGPAINDPRKKPIYYAIPYMAANTPADESIFADRWETVNKTFMMYLVKNLSLDDLSMILLDLRTISQSSIQGLDIKSEFTQACPNYNLLNLRFNGQNMLVDPDGGVQKCMKSRSPSAIRLIFYWVIRMVFEKEQFYAEQITSNAINLTTMFPSVQGYSGTIDNVNILPHQVMIEAEKDHRINEQANGAITMKLLQQKDCVTTVQKIEQYTKLEALIDAMCAGFNDLSAFSAFIDVGALLKDFTNAEVALALAKKFKRRTILYWDERSNQLSFLEYDFKTGSEHRAALEGSETNYLNAATNSIVKNRFTYYDQRHITGSDILQPPTAKAFLTIGPKVLLRDILQGVMRMRQFQSGQSIHFITTSAVETLLSKFCEGVKPESNAGFPRVNQHHLIALGAINEDEKQLAENIRLYRVKVDAELRAFVMDRLTEALVLEDPFANRMEMAERGRNDFTFKFEHEDLFRRTRSLFIRNVQENPVNWATRNIQTPTDVAVQRYIEGRVALIPGKWKTLPQWKHVEENLKVLSEKLPEDRDHPDFIKYARSVLNYLSPTLELSQVPDKFKAPQSQVVDQGSTIEMELQLELQQELQLELEQQLITVDSQEPLDEPQLAIPQLEVSAGRNAFEMADTSPVPSKTDRWSFLNQITELISPWELKKQYAGSADVSEVLTKMFNADLFCPGYGEAGNVDAETYCKSLPGFVGISAGLAKVSTSSVLDFITMASREATHLLFWQGRLVNDSSDKAKHAVFLISGSEAITLHKLWNYRSCSMNNEDSFWLTDLYGFEVHGPSFASTSYSSNQFSLLEALYEESFADLHFRALALNASHNVIVASKAMYWRMRAWIGDNDALKMLHNDSSKVAPVLNSEKAAERVKYFINRLTWMSKLRDEIVPDDPLIELMMRVSAKLPVDFEKSSGSYEELLNRSQTETFSNSVVVTSDEVKDSKSKAWPASKNVNMSKPINYFNVAMALLVIFGLIGVAYIWGRNAGIDWKKFFIAKIAAFGKVFVNAATEPEPLNEKNEDEECENEDEVEVEETAADEAQTES